MSKLTPIFMFLIFMLVVGSTPLSQAQNSELKVLVIYDTSTDLNQLQIAMNNITGITTTTKQLDAVTVSDINDADAILLGSSVDITWESDIDLAFASFLGDSRKMAFIVSPHLGEFEDEVEEKLAIDNENNVFDENNTAVWSIELKVSIDDSNSGDKYQTSGSMGVYTIDSGTPVIAEVVNTTLELEETTDFPFPVLWNATDGGARIVAGSFALDPTAENPDDLRSYDLELHQLPNFYNSIVQGLIASVIQFQVEIIDQLDGGDNPPGGDSIGNLINFSLSNIQWLIAGLVAIVLLVFARIFGVIEWLVRKSYGLIFAVFGAFYNIQERSLSHNEVMMNHSRIAIIDYLDHVQKYGAHLREIKSVTKFGSGSMLWHLQVLEDYYIIEKFDISGYTVFVTSDYNQLFDPYLKKIELKLQSKYTFPLLEYFHEQGQSGPFDISQIEDSIDVPRSSLRRLLRKFEEFHLISIEKSPSISVEIEDTTSLRSLYESNQLRLNYEFSEETARVSLVDDIN